ncbi:MAG: alpha/beta hydrolase [Bacteroidota bacterium]
MHAVLNYEVSRLHHSKEWIVFIHGAGGSIKTWSRQADAFKDRYNLAFIDLRDHGKSKNIQPEYEKYNFQIITNDIKRVLDELKIERAHFITLSFGSVLLQDFAFRHPDMIKRAVFVGGIFNGGLLIRAFVFLAKAFNLFLPYPVMYRIFSYLLMPRKRNQFARRLYQTQALKITQKEYMKWLGLYREFFKLLSNFSTQTLTFPSLVVMGSLDYIFLKNAYIFSDNQALSSIREIEGVGHIANIESPEVFNKISLDFLSS